MNEVKAKFLCLSVNDFGHSKEVTMNAVYGTKGENADFAKASPSGTFTLRIESDRPAANYFQPGKSYYFNISEAPAE